MVVAPHEAILAGIEPVWAPNGVHELRVIQRPGRIACGYFDDPERFARAAMTWNEKAPAVYMTLNPVSPDLAARAYNRVEDYARTTTADADIIRRRWLPLDFDPARPAGISSTEDEHEAAILRARDCGRWLLTEFGFSRDAMVLADSGNGGHLLVRIDLPNDDQATEVVRRCLEAAALYLEDAQVKVDTSVYNASRIWKVYGTVVRKGDNLPTRPHRQARLIQVPA